ncbi:uncharacterized protein LOC134848447 [Symsagittifera roscoffensis]|uniref:uncharacterized protein LOC134848447 n=1 Tax=Symsagittifera roscoffensis TaxID=84072 RepID=UPI00307C0C43
MLVPVLIGFLAFIVVGGLLVYFFKHKDVPKKESLLSELQKVRYTIDTDSTAGKPVELRTGKRLGHPMSVDEIPLSFEGDIPELDLHGFYVEEACELLINCYKVVDSRGYKLFKVITGRGNHSEEGGPRIKPIVEEILDLNGLQWEFGGRNNSNIGCMIVSIKKATKS